MGKLAKGSGTDMASFYELFLSFLKRKGCERAFRDNFFRYNRFTVFCSDMWDVIGGDEYVINRAFDWADTPQGRDYWKKIDAEWETSYMKAWRKQKEVAKKV